jgi:hypothetical protein
VNAVNAALSWQKLRGRLLGIKREDYNVSEGEDVEAILMETTSDTMRLTVQVIQHSLVHSPGFLH